MAGPFAGRADAEEGICALPEMRWPRFEDRLRAGK